MQSQDNNQLKTGARVRNVFITVAIVVATIACYWPARNFSFINYDDDVYVVDNAVVAQGLTGEGIAWAFSTFAVANWHPITWLSHMVDVSLFGNAAEAAGAHHMMNVAIHAVNAALLLWLLFLMTGAFWRSALVAALFAMHPLHVESVAWIAERKDVLSTFFGLLTLMMYVKWVRMRQEKTVSRSRRMIVYVSIMALFALSLMSKPMLVTLPCVMLLMDVWPLSRFRILDSGFWSDAARDHVARSKIHNPKSNIPPLGLIVEKLPLFAMSVVSSVVTMMAQSRSGAVWSVESLSVPERLANAAVAYGQYLRQAVWPSGLSVIYPLPSSLAAWQVATALIVLIIVTITCVMMWKRRPWLMVGWLWFLGTLVPVIGLVQVGPQARADRYTYVPLIGVFIMIAWSLPAVTRAAVSLRSSRGTRRDRKKASTTDHPRVAKESAQPAVNSSSAMHTPVVAACVGVLIALSVVTWNYLHAWRDSITLFAYALQVTDRNSIAHGNMAAALANLNPPDLAGAIEHNHKAIEYWPGNAKAAKNLGNALVAAGQPAEAVQFLNQALATNPRYVEAFSDLGAAYARLGQPALAIEQYERALAIDPDFVEARSNLGGALVAMQRSAEAVPHLENVLARRPEYAKARFNYACALGELGDIERSIAEFERTLALNPNLPDARFNLATMLLRANRVEDAIAHYEALLALNPNHAMAHNSLARALSAVGRYEQAIGHMQRVLELAPDNPSALVNMATLLLDAHDADDADGSLRSRALAAANRAVELTSGGDAAALGILARARATNGDFAGAINAAQQAMDLAAASGDADLAGELGRQIDAYRAGRVSP